MRCSNNERFKLIWTRPGWDCLEETAWLPMGDSKTRWAEGLKGSSRIIISKMIHLIQIIFLRKSSLKGELLTPSCWLRTFDSKLLIFNCWSRTVDFKLLTRSSWLQTVAMSLKIIWKYSDRLNRLPRFRKAFMNLKVLSALFQCDA